MNLKYPLTTIALITLAAASARADTEVTVQVSGLGEPVGNLVVTAFDSKRSWLKKPAATATVSLAETMDQPIEVQMTLPPGAYAFQVYHDMDGNGKMKTNFIGIPKEPTGVSNGAKGRFGPPKFKDAAVDIADESQTVSISLVEI